MIAHAKLMDRTKIEELETTVMELEKERDFYFGKLRNVELMLQVKQDANFEGCELEGVVGNIFKVLYATVEEEVEVAEDGEVSTLSAETRERGIRVCILTS
jgi:RP/EB family microtubule-associated protein